MGQGEIRFAAIGAIHDLYRHADSHKSRARCLVISPKYEMIWQALHCASNIER